MRGYLGYSVAWLAFFALALVLGLVLNALAAALLGQGRWDALPPTVQQAWALYGGLLYVLLPHKLLVVVMRLEAVLLAGREEFLRQVEDSVREQADDKLQKVDSKGVRWAFAFLRRVVYVGLALLVVLWGLVTGLLVGLGVAIFGASFWGLLYALALLGLVLGARRFLGRLRSLLERGEVRSTFGLVWRLRGVLG